METQTREHLERVDGLEVYRDDAGGWAVRRPGEAEALTHHETREEAHKAARVHSDDGVEVDLRQGIFTNDPKQAVRTGNLARTVLIAAAAVVVLLVAISLITAL